MLTNVRDSDHSISIQEILFLIIFLWTAAVTQLVERLLLAPESSSSNPFLLVGNRRLP